MKIIHILFCLLLGTMAQASITPDNRPRPSSYPYISGDTFRAYADFVFDEGSLNFNPTAVKDGNVIFFSINSPLFHDHLENFFREFHPKINARYILITHNTDCSSPGKSARYLEDDKLIAWFAINTDIYFHPKLFPIPIGIVHPLSPFGMGKLEMYDELTKNFVQQCLKKDKLLYMNFSIRTNVNERKPAYDYFSKTDFCTNANYKPGIEYFEELMQFKFVVCPTGTGIDCHRTWEALLLGTIPVLRRSTIDRLFEDLPVVLVDRWEEVTKEFLEQKYIELLPILLTYDRKKLYADYWFNLIQKQKEN